jgi:ABC-type nitrate/sulfonate/bicarbonate transport system substrate-binding protein
MVRRTIRRLAVCLIIPLSACTGHADNAGSQGKAALPTLSITVFAAPSQSIWLPVLIKKLKLDEKQGFELVVTPKPGPIAYLDFASGADPVCYCAAPAAVARFVEQGASISLVWNAFNLDSYVVTKRPDILALGDLAGKQVGADTGTGSWAIAAWLLQQNGLDLQKVQLNSSSSSAAMRTDLDLGRLDAAVLGQIDVATLKTTVGESGKYRVIDLNRAALWKKYADIQGIPSIELGVWRAWLDAPGHRELLRKFYRANLAAAAYIREHPQQAAGLISADTSISKAALLYLFEHDPDMIDLRPSSEYKAAIRKLTQKLLPQAKLLERPFTDAELDAYVADFQP